VEQGQPAPLLAQLRRRHRRHRRRIQPAARHYADRSRGPGVPGPPLRSTEESFDVFGRAEHKTLRGLRRPELLQPSSCAVAVSECPGGSRRMPSKKVPSGPAAGPGNSATFVWLSAAGRRGET
jgi:hypothetical protein